MLFVQSVCITQLELLDAVQAVTGKRLDTEYCRLEGGKGASSA
jgi:hypothetical protein